MKTKVIVLLSIVLLIFAGPALADISGSAELYQGMTDEQFQGAQAIQNEGGDTIGGEMLQSSKKEMLLEADTSATIDCEDCEDAVVGGFTMQSAQGEAMQFDGQGQLATLGEGSINIDKYFTMESSKDGTWSFDKQYDETKTESKEKTKVVDEDYVESKTETKVVDEDSSSEGSFEIAANAECTDEETVTETSTGTFTDNDTQEDSDCPDCDYNKSESVTETDTHTFSGDLSGSGSSSESWDKSVTETKDKSESWDKSVTETKDETKTKSETLAMSGSYAENCSFETHRGTTLSWAGDGVVAGQVQGGYQAGSVSSFTAAGVLECNVPR